MRSFAPILAALAFSCAHGSQKGETSAPMSTKDIFAPTNALPPAPVAKKVPEENERHGITWVDEYAWLKDDSYPKVDDEAVLSYLEEENAYFQAAMKPFDELTQTLFSELEGRLKKDESSVPVKDGEWLYQWRFEKGAQYRKWYRTPAGGGDPQLILDEPALAEGKEFFRVTGINVSNDGRLLAWGEDTNGSERYTIRIKNLETGEMLSDEIPETSGGTVWSSDASSLLYMRVSEEWRPYQARLHVIGNDPSMDHVVYEEQDTGFFAGVSLSQSREWAFIRTGDHITSETYVLPASDLAAEPVLVAAREVGHEYDLDHANGTFYIRTNDTHENFRIATAPEDAPQRANWKELIAGSREVYIRGFASFKEFMALQERVNGLDQIRLRRYDGGEHRIEFPESAYAAAIGNNPEFDINTLRVSYESMVTPDTVYDYDVSKKTLTVLKVQEIPSGYDASQYVTERKMAKARDGVMVPVSIVYRRDFEKDSGRPLHLYGYGAYGLGMRPSFDSNRLSLLDRGFVYAIAHIRGGDEMGYDWYTSGKLEKRTNTFNDFVDVARFLIEEGYATRGNITISGGSAGGELMGAVVNQAPELFRGVVAHVPFVDVLNTMLDTSLPLTPMEWPEWGNPIEDKAAFELIRSYSPYDNVEAKDYPPMLITGGLNDPRVTYWEPAKWAAKLRATKTDNNLLLLKINMGAGHAGKTGRYVRLEEKAEEYTFLLMVTGLAE